VGFSLGGAVALEMALQRPESVPRLSLINGLATYRIDDWRKWVAARLPGAMIRISGMGLLGRYCAWRMFSPDWQKSMRERAARVIAAEFDYPPPLQKREIVIRGSRHGTPFDSVEATNTSLTAWLASEPLPSGDQRHCDLPRPSKPLTFIGSLAEQHALGP
jgi:pimeloyl-ACP methyl ester carboxylesterase